MVACLLVAVCVARPSLGDDLNDRVISRIAFGSCANQDLPQPIFGEIVSRKPELFLFLGDNIYADTDDMKVMAAKYQKLGASPDFQRLREQCPLLATWDDHDYGVNDGNRSYARKQESQRLMQDFFGVPPDSPLRRRDGVYRFAEYGPPGRRLQIILLDTRYWKGEALPDMRSEAEKKHLNILGWYVPNRDPDATLLGAEQWRWLEGVLQRPADLRLVVSSIQVVADEKGMESWGNFPVERDRLYQLIARTDARHVMFLSGDVHFSEVSFTTRGPYPIYDFTASGLTHSEPSWAAAVNSHRVSPHAYAKSNFGLIEIDWNDGPASVRLSAIGLNGEVGYQMTVRP